MTQDELIKLLNEYDFLKNSVKKFSNEYKISEKTITKYLKQNNILYNSRTLLLNKNRDVNGKFCLPNKQNTNKIIDLQLNNIETDFSSIGRSNNDTLTYEEKLRRIMTHYL